MTQCGCKKPVWKVVGALCVLLWALTPAMTVLVIGGAWRGYWWVVAPIWNEKPLTGQVLAQSVFVAADQCSQEKLKSPLMQLASLYPEVGYSRVTEVKWTDHSRDVILTTATLVPITRTGGLWSFPGQLMPPEEFPRVLGLPGNFALISLKSVGDGFECSGAMQSTYNGRLTHTDKSRSIVKVTMYSLPEE